MKQIKADDARERAFHQALTRGDVVAVGTFLDEGFSVHHRSDDMPPPMACAITKGSVELARLLLQRGYDINQPLGDSQRTALLHAFEASPEVFEFLLAAGADLNARDKYGFTLAHLVAASPKSGSELLLAKLSRIGLQLNARNNFRETPFTQANRFGQLKCAEFLLEEGTDVNQRGRNNMTSLIIAGQKGLLEVCQWLIARGADIQAKDDFNKTALDWAKANGHTKVVEFLEQQLAAKT